MLAKYSNTDLKDKLDLTPDDIKILQATWTTGREKKTRCDIKSVYLTILRCRLAFNKIIYKIRSFLFRTRNRGDNKLSKDKSPKVNKIHIIRESSSQPG